MELAETNLETGSSTRWTPPSPPRVLQDSFRGQWGVPRGGVRMGRNTFRSLNLILPLAYSAVLTVKTIGS